MNDWSLNNPEREIERIVDFIQNYVQKDENIVVPVSGGLDSDIVARLCCKSVGKNRVRLFIVIQSEMEAKFLRNAQILANELDVPLAEIHLENMNMDLMKALEYAESGNIFRTNMMLDPAKAKCSVRSSVLSCYQDKGFLIAGTMNKTEKTLGFFLTFGDNLAHFKPIAHLYKSELKELAKILGTRNNVIEQESSAGFWEGQTDIEDLAYWIVNDGPIVFPRTFTEEECERVGIIRSMLDFRKIDVVLKLYNNGAELSEIIKATVLAEEIVIGLIHIAEKSKMLKNRQLMLEIPESGE